jgi:hypothetical protein
MATQAQRIYTEEQNLRPGEVVVDPSRNQKRRQPPTPREPGNNMKKNQH